MLIVPLDPEQLMGRIGPCFTRVEPRLQAGRYLDALTSDLRSAGPGSKGARWYALAAAG